MIDSRSEQTEVLMNSLHGESSARKYGPAASFGPWLRHPAAAVVAAYIVFAAACSSSMPVRVSPGETTDAVLSSAGPPSTERTLPDGTKALFYVRGPGGFTTYRVRVAQDGRVIDNVQLLTEKNFMDSLIAGKTSERDVLDNLGPPGAVSRHPN